MHSQNAKQPTQQQTQQKLSMVKIVDSDMEKAMRKILACPICYNKLTWIEAAGMSELGCGICKKSYFHKETHIDLSIASGAKSYGEHMATSTELFRNPLVSFLYERGWRQSFKIAGFPGLEKEFVLMKEYLEPAFGGTIVDASCGSGLFSRLFAKSGLFCLVIALDYSESMLKQCYNFIKEDENFPQKELMLVRADISRLPFVTSSVDAVHAGAALHCWPSPSAAVAEISRVLRPGGIFVATTFIFNRHFAYIPFIRIVRQGIKHIFGGHFFLSEGELEDLCSTCGLVNFKYFQNRSFVMISATKTV